MSAALAAAAAWLPPDAALRLTIGAALAVLVAFGGWVGGALTLGGALGAVLVGTLVFGGGGPAWAALLVLFFVSSSALSRWHADLKVDAEARSAKGARRDLVQVLANGAVPAVLAVLALARGDAALAAAFAAFAGAVAAATADTWATEVGLLSDAPPALITTGAPVPPGTSGGVTVVGTLAAVAGATLVGLAAAALLATRDVFAVGILDARLVDWDALRLLPVTAAAGLASAAVDSLLGATVQAVYRVDGAPDAAAGADPAHLTERPRRPDGSPRPLARGWRWVTNDVVNLVATAFGALVGWGLFVA